MIGNVERRLSVGVMRTGKHGVKPRAGLCQCIGERRLHRRKAFPVVEAARDARLIGDQHHRNTEAVTLRDGAGSAGEHSHLFRPAEIVGIFNDDAVAVEKQSRPAGKISSEYLRPEPAHVAARFEVRSGSGRCHCSIARSTSAQIACPATM